MSSAPSKAGSVCIAVAAFCIGVFVGLACERLLLRRPGAAAYRGEIADASREFGVDAGLVAAVVECESGGRKDAVSRSGAVGLMQLMPRTAEEAARRIGLPASFDLADPETNVRLGTSHLARLLARFDGEAVFAIAAYHAGAGRVETWALENSVLSAAAVIEAAAFDETRIYVRRVTHLAKAFRQSGPFAGGSPGGKPTGDTVLWEMFGVNVLLRDRGGL